MPNLLSSFLLLCMVATGMSASKSYGYQWNKDKFPNPRKDPAPFCNLLYEPSFVCDPDKVLDARQIQNLDTLINEFGELTKCPCKMACKPNEGSLRVGIAIMRRFNETTGLSPQEELRKFADHLRDRWDLGTCDNSVVIAIATEKPLVVISVGSRATTDLPETALEDLFEVNVPYILNKREFYRGLRSILNMYKAAIVNKNSKDAGASGFDAEGNSLLSGSQGWGYYVSMGLVFIFFCVLVIFCVFLVLVCLRRQREDEGTCTSGREGLRGWFSRDLWRQASRSDTPIKKAPATAHPVEKAGTLGSAAAYDELPTSEVRGKAPQQTNLDDIPEADFDDEEGYPRGTKV